MHLPSRNLHWDGCLNVRDLGGLPLVGGGSTRFGVVVRADNPAFLTASGWRSLAGYGVRTIVALRTEGSDDVEPDEQVVPPGVAVRRVVVEDGTDAEFVMRCVETLWFGTPIYFREMLSTWPERCAAGIAAVIDAEPGVVISCGRGCDRTGLVSFLLLALAGVEPDAIAHDWSTSVARLRPRDPSYEQELQGVLVREGTTVLDTITDILATTDVADRLVVGGLSTAQIDTARHLLVPTP